MVTSEWETTSTGTEGHEDLMSEFERSGTLVHDVFHRLEADVIRPTIAYGVASFHERPISTIFVAVMTTLSLIPVLTFVFVSASMFVFVLFSAIFSALFLSAGMTLFFASLLATVLGVTFFISILATGGILGAYALVRLISTLRFHRQHDLSIRAGFDEWKKEMQNLASGSSSSDQVDDWTLVPSSSGNPVATKPDETQDGPATVEKHRELDEDHTQRLQSQHHINVHDERPEDSAQSNQDTTTQVAKPEIS